MAVLIRRRVPKTIQWLVKLFFIYLLIFMLFRVATVVLFKPDSIPVSSLLPSFWLGMKYDLRWIAFLLFPIAAVSVFPKLSPFYNETSKKFWTIYLGIITLLALFFYGADFGQFAYVNARLNADALIVAEDPVESLQTIWESYPVIWILLALIGAVIMMTWMFRRTHVVVSDSNAAIHKFGYRRRWHVLAILILGWFMYGFLTAKPLDFYRAFNLKDEFRSNLALNPMQNFFTTLRFRKPDFTGDVKKHYPVVSRFLGISQARPGKFSRIGLPDAKALESKPNVILVICESFSMYKSSMSGNPLNTTPYFNSLTKEGVFYDRCFSPSFGTARGVFAVLTGIPDVQLSTFATRNEATVKQRTIINDFHDYEKFYFIGGRSVFNNFKGLISNINGVNIYEEGRYKAKKLNAWGISDHDLFKEATTVLAPQQRPFFAVIQTADNHRPYNFPEEDKDFTRRSVPEDSLQKYGFESLAELNAFSYSDYCFRKFMEGARKQPWFNNTLFVFVGDHGVEGNATQMYPAAWTERRLADEHVPLLFYAPALLEPAHRRETVSQIDILPTIAAISGIEYRNTTLGRDLTQPRAENGAFIVYHAPGWIGFVNDEYYYRKNLRIQKEELVSATAKPLILTAPQRDSVLNHMSALTTGLYETAKWMLVRNKR